MSLVIGVSVAWMAEHNFYADGVRHRVWQALATRPDWSEWLGTYMDLQTMHSYVYFEERSSDRLLMRGDNVFYYVPATYVEAAHRARNLPDFMAGLFRDIFAKWADKRGFPPPPPADLPTGPSGTRGPSRFP